MWLQFYNKFIKHLIAKIIALVLFWRMSNKTEAILINIGLKNDHE